MVEKVIEYFGVSTFLFLLGLYCLGTKRNLIKNVIGILVLIAGVNLNFVSFSFMDHSVNLLGHSIVITIIVIEGCVISITLAYVYAAYREIKSLDVRKLRGD